MNASKPLAVLGFGAGLLVAAGLTWAAHSSVAVVLVVMSLGAANLVSPTAVVAMVLGANVGSALNPLIEASQRGNPASRRLPIGNIRTPRRCSGPRTS